MRARIRFALIAFALAALPLGIATQLPLPAVAQSVGQLFQNMQAGAGRAPSIKTRTGSGGVFFPSAVSVGLAGHVHGGNASTANLPVLSSCGTSPALATGSNDFVGRLTTGSGATTCTITFGTTYGAAPSCHLSAEGTATQPTYTTSATAITVSVDIASTVYNYLCVGLAPAS